MKLFILQREEDISGVSGTGTVAEGVTFTDGTVVLRWLGQRRTTVVHESIENVLAIHGHEGRTRVVWVQSSEANDSLLSSR